jgi:protein-tyrosine-phosphatase
MAEAFAKKHLRSNAIVRSAGFDPKPEYDSKSAIRTLREEFGIDASGHRQTHVSDVNIDSFNYLVAMDPAISERLKKLTTRKIITWSIDDPWAGDPAEYRVCALQIRSELASLLVRISTS